MPIKECTINGKNGYKWGDQGKCYIGYNAKDKALAQGLAIDDIKMASNKISFDYDSTLSTDKGKSLAKEKINDGNIVYIITSRIENGNNDSLFNIAKELGIDKNHIFFTNHKDKWETIKKLNIDIHYDNNQEQIDKINSNTNTKGIKFELSIHQRYSELVRFISNDNTTIK